MRIDKFLWSVRLFKTRALAAEACKKGRVVVGEITAKASRNVSQGDVIKVKYTPIWREYRVKDVLKNRVGAKLVPDYIEEVTSQEELEKIEELKMAQVHWDKGSGRPTKKQRRDLEKFKEH